MAAHVHDSVLQTLSLIQKAAGDPREVVRLARIEERELRHWLFDPARLGRHGDRPETLDDALAGIEREVEDSYGVGRRAHRGGGLPDGRCRGALVGACREADRQRRQVVRLHGGLRLRRGRAGHVVSAYVRDLGVGFDPAWCPPTARASPASMVERMARARWPVTVSSAPGTGTEVELVLPRTATDR